MFGVLFIARIVILDVIWTVNNVVDSVAVVNVIIVVDVVDFIDFVDDVVGVVIVVVVVHLPVEVGDGGPEELQLIAPGKGWQLILKKKSLTPHTISYFKALKLCTLSAWRHEYVCSPSDMAVKVN